MGMECHTKRTKAFKFFSWNFLARGMAERFLFTTIDKDFCCQCGCGGRCTLDPILSIFVWSMTMMSLCQWPTQRHDGQPWLDSDTHRKLKRGPFFAIAVLFQARGDWSWYKELFGFPSWASKAICWCCRATRTGPNRYTDHGENAKWRSKRITAIEFFDLQRRAGVTPSPLFSCPFFTLSMVVIDILHCLDLGVAQDALGNLFFEAQKSDLCAGRTQKLRVKKLWLKVKEYYKTSKPLSQIQTLTRTMIKQPTKSPKLKLKGAETRGLIPFGMELATELHTAINTGHTAAVKNLFTTLLDVYMLMASETYDSDAASKACREFCLHYGALSDEAELKHGAQCHFWREKQKIHMLQELFEFQGRDFDMNPAEFWCYRDEDFVGWVAGFAGSRGGPSRCVSNTLRTLQRYRAWIRDL